MRPGRPPYPLRPREAERLRSKQRPLLPLPPIHKRARAAVAPLPAALAPQSEEILLPEPEGGAVALLVPLSGPQASLGARASGCGRPRGRRPCRSWGPELGPRPGRSRAGRLSSSSSTLGPGRRRRGRAAQQGAQFGRGARPRPPPSPPEAEAAGEVLAPAGGLAAEFLQRSPLGCAGRLRPRPDAPQVAIGCRRRRRLGRGPARLRPLRPPMTSSGSRPGSWRPTAMRAVCGWSEKGSTPQVASCPMPRCAASSSAPPPFEALVLPCLGPSPARGGQRLRLP